MSTDEELKVQDDFLEENDNDGLTLDELTAGNQFISNPKVGEDVEFIVKKISKLEGAQCIVKKKDGGTFNKSMSSVDYCYEVTTSEDAVYTISSWEQFGKIKAILKKLGKIEGAELKIAHIKDGMKDRDGDNYSVCTKIEGVWKALDKETNAWV